MKVYTLLKYVDNDLAHWLNVNGIAYRQNKELSAVWRKPSYLFMTSLRELISNSLGMNTFRYNII